MEPTRRIRICLLLEKMEQNKRLSEKIGLKDTSHFTNNRV